AQAPVAPRGAAIQVHDARVADVERRGGAKEPDLRLSATIEQGNDVVGLRSRLPLVVHRARDRRKVTGPAGVSVVAPFEQTLGSVGEPPLPSLRCDGSALGRIADPLPIAQRCGPPQKRIRPLDDPRVQADPRAAVTNAGALDL